MTEKSQIAAPRHDMMASMAKAVLIMLMVIGHTDIPPLFYDFIHLFHMPAFFFLSGYLFKEKYLNSAIDFVTKRFRNYYVPYVKWSLIFLLLGGIFYYWGISSEKYLPDDYISHALKILTLSRTEPLLLQYWFLRTLLVASLIFYLVLRIAPIKSNMIKGVIYSFLFMVMALGYSLLNLRIPYLRTSTFLACSFMFMGYVYKNIDNKIFHNRWIGVLLLTVVLMVACFVHWNIDVTGFNIPLYYIIALAGTVGICNCMCFIPKSWRPVFDYVGSRTIYILTFHLICFKIVGYAIIKIEDLPMSYLADNFVVSTDNSFYWISYTLVGILVPLGLLEFYQYVTSRVKSLFVIQSGTK